MRRSQSVYGFAVVGFEVVSRSVPFQGHSETEIIGKLNKEVARIMQSAEVAPKLAADGSLGVGGTPEAFASLLKAEDAKWGKLVKEIGLKSE